jgi:hypothetical protein
VPGVGVVLDPRRLVRAPEADQVGRDGPDTRLGEHGHHVAVEERPAGLAVQQQGHGSVRGSALDVRHPEPCALAVRDVGVARLDGEVGQGLEPVLGRAQQVHDRSLAHPPGHLANRPGVRVSTSGDMDVRYTHLLPTLDW